jgi:hypothetical protein
MSTMSTAPASVSDVPVAAVHGGSGGTAKSKPHMHAACRAAALPGPWPDCMTVYEAVRLEWQ